MLVYILQGASFIVGVTYIAAVIVHYVKKDAVSGTWLASHFTWQIRTVWYGAAWMAIGYVTYWMFLG